jgi:hypothetical protein
MRTFKDKTYNLCTGQIVKWDGGLYIVAADPVERVGPNGNIVSIELIDLEACNCMVYPSTIWPSKKRGIDFIKVVGNCLKDYLEEHTIKSIFR